MSTQDPFRSFSLLRPNQASFEDDARLRAARDITPGGSGQPPVPAGGGAAPVPTYRPPKGFFGRFRRGQETRGVKADTEHEQAHRDLVAARDARQTAEEQALLRRELFEVVRPYVVEHNRLSWQGKCLQALCAVNELFDRLESQRTQSVRRKQLEECDHTNELIRRRITEASLLAELAQAGQLTGSNLEVLLSGNGAKVAQNRAAAAEFRAREQSYGPKPQPQPSERRESGFSRAMEEEVGRSGVISNDVLRMRARVGDIVVESLMAGREPSEREWREISDLIDSLERATGINQRKAASDLGFKK